MTSLLSFLTHHLQVLSLESSHDWYSFLPSHPSLSEFRWLQTRGFNSNYFNQICSGSSRFSKAHLQGKPFFICSFPPLKKSFVFLPTTETNQWLHTKHVFLLFLAFQFVSFFRFFFFFTWAVISFLNPSLFSGLFLSASLSCGPQLSAVMTACRASSEHGFRWLTTYNQTFKFALSTDVATAVWEKWKGREDECPLFFLTGKFSFFLFFILHFCESKFYCRSSEDGTFALNPRFDNFQV